MNNLSIINNFPCRLLKGIEVCIVVQHIASGLIVRVDITVYVAASLSRFLFEHLWRLYFPDLLPNAFDG